MPVTTPDPPSTLSGEAECCDVPHEGAPLERLRAALIGPATIAALADTFKMLGDPTRLRLVDALARRELCVCDLAALVGLSESAVSHQLRLLRTLRLVRTRRAGRRVFYALDDQHIVALLQQGLRHVEEAPDASAGEA
jgi:DNA-binding transcriptional ArsR family regulator